MGMDEDSRDDPERTELIATRSTAAAAEGEALPAGTRIGNYRLLQRVGHGGMGDVYRAEQLEPVQREVALKLVRSRRLDARHIAYFEVERQLLARMRHPAIAQIHDAGTTADGHPYFAMEFIGGTPITQFCDAHRLPLADRIKLFIRVCEGVQHAHQKGVVHRDLKPGNLLVDEVDGRALPKIIDFGIATLAADVGGREIAGTPDYMSPEQAGDDPALVDARSDVFALGVVLGELLTGQRPLATGETAAHSARTFRLPSEQISTLPPGDAVRIAQARGQSLPHMRRLLRSELDHVVAKAMRHERAERYPSAAALAGDLQRFLDGHPLEAVPSGRAYALRKFAARHRPGIMAATVALLALVGGFALSVYGLLQARAQRAIAVQRSAQLEKVAAFQQAMLESIDIEAMGLGVASDLRAQIAKQAPQSAAALDAALAHASTSDLARGVINRNLLDNAERAIGRDFSSEPAIAADLRESVAHVRLALGLPEQAARGFAEVAAWRQKVLGATAPETLKAQDAWARALLDAADAKSAQGVVERAMTALASLPPDDPLRIRLRVDQADIAAALGDRAKARTLLETLRVDAIRLRGERDPATMEVTDRLAILLGRMGDPEAGRRLLEALVPMRARVLGPDAADTLASQHNLAVMRIMTGDGEGAVALQRALVATRTRRLGAEHPLTLSDRANLANMLNDSGKSSEAIPIAREVLTTQVRVLGSDDPRTLRTRLNLATFLARTGLLEEALQLQQQVLDARTRLLGPRHPDTLFIAINNAGTLHQAGQDAAALARLDRVLPIARDVLGERDRQLQAGWDIRAQAAESLGKTDAAVSAWRELLRLREAAYGERNAKTVDAAWQAEGLLRKQGHIAQAEVLRARYVLPLLQADPATLDERQVAMRENIIRTEREEAQAGSRQ